MTARPYSHYTYGELAALTREQFYALALMESDGKPYLAEFATQRLWDSGFLHRHGAGKPARSSDA